MKRTLCASLLIVPLWAGAAAPTVEIKVDQAGYITGAAKTAMVVSQTEASEFVVRSSADGRPAFRGKLTAAVRDPDSGDRVQVADFSSVTQPGTFYVDVPGVGRSWEFRIGPDVYSRAFYLSMRSFYGQRCGMAVDLGPDFPGYAYPACHIQGAFHASSGRSGPKRSAGGWHDAGDYGRYIVNSGITTGTLLWAWELYGSQVGKVRLDIPESDNGTPDILDEIRWNLDWMLSMQDEDGGVWHKQTSERFAGFVMPDKDTLVSLVIGTGVAPYRSTCATADFAAVTAIAGRVYLAFDAAYARKCLEAARRAWSWTIAHPDVAFRNPAGVVTGEYGDGNCGDERLWAAAELWRTTSEEQYGRYFLDHQAEYRSAIQVAGPPAWPNVAPLALWAFALNPKADPAVAGAIRRESLAAADQIAQRSLRHPYRISLTTRDYVWGSNSVAMNYGLQLLVAHAMRSDGRYVEAALDNLHYILGRNTFSLSWVTQVGANSFRHPHHRPSAADDRAEPWPGLLSGGPNGSKQDPALRKLPDLPPARTYLDDQESYASNENAINWNAALVFVLAGIQHSSAAQAPTGLKVLRDR